MSFGTEGYAKVEFLADKVYVIDEIMFIANRIVVLGTVQLNSVYYSSVSVFLANGEPDASFGTNGAIIHEKIGRSYCRGGAYNASSHELFLCGSARRLNAQSELLIMKYRAEPSTTTTVFKEQPQRAFSVRLATDCAWITNPDFIKGNATLHIYDFQGRLLLTEGIYIDEMNTTIVYFSQSLKPGIYISALIVGKDVYSYKGVVW